jgi:hypothetical protein
MRNALKLAFTFALTATSIATALHAQTPPPPAPASPAEAPKAAPPAPTSTVITIGKERKQTVGKISDLDKGDNGCYVVFMDDKKNEFVEVGTFDLCAMSPSPKGKRAEFTYKVETIPASSCGGDKKCTKTETLAIITAIKVLE